MTDKTGKPPVPVTAVIEDYFVIYEPDCLEGGWVCAGYCDNRAEVMFKIDGVVQSTYCWEHVYPTNRRIIWFEAEFKMNG